MRKNEQKVRHHFVKMRMNDEEFQALHKLWKGTTERNLSNYLRKVVLCKPVIVKYRNASADDFLSSMLQLKKDLHQVSSNFNQAVKRLSVLEQIPEFKTWLILNESLQRNVATNIEEIRLRIAQLYDEWLLR